MANQNIPHPSIQILRRNNFDVLSISEKYSGIADQQVIEIAQKERRIILTFDKDYGELLVRNSISDPPAVIFFRYKGEFPTAAGEMLMSIINLKSIQFDGHFTVVESDRIRQRKY